MAAKKGHVKSGGRVAGTLNHQTSELRSFVSEIIYNNMQKIQADIEGLEPDKRIALFEKLLHFVLPKPQAAEFPIESGLVRYSCGTKTWVIPSNVIPSNDEG